MSNIVQIGPPLGIPFRLNQASPQSKGLAAWWPMLAQGGGIIRNFGRPYSLNLTLQDNATFSAAASMGRVLTLDGTNDYASNATAALGFTGDAAWSITLWLNPSALTNDSMWVSYGTTSHGNTICIGTAGGNFKTTAYGFDTTFGVAPTLNVWQHVALTYDPAVSTAYLYVNGVQKATWSVPDNYVIQATGPMYIGSATWGTRVGACQIGDVRIYNRTLSAGEVTSMFLPQTRWELYASLWTHVYYAPPSATIIDPGTVSTPYPYILRDRAPLRARYRATLYSPQGYPQALITGYSQLSYTLTTSSDGGGFSIALPPTMDRALIKDGSFVTIDRTLDGGVPHFEDCYIVLSTPEAQAKKGTRFPTIEGPSVTGYVTGKDFRAIGQLDSTLGSFVTAVPADNAIKYFVSRNMAAGAENNTFGDTADRRGRDISKFIGFTVEKDRSLGPTITYNASLKALDVAIRDIAKLCEENAGNPARLFWYVRPKSFNPLTFEFVTFLGKLPSAAHPKVPRGAFNTYRGFDSAAPVILGPAFGTVIETDGEHDLRENYNSTIFTFNTKTDLSRITDKARAAEFSMAFRERLADAKDSGTETEGKAEMRGTLKEGRPRFVTRFRIVDSLATAYGRDYFLGDILGCLALDRRFEAEVSGIDVNQTRDGDSITIKIEEIVPFTV